MFLNGFIFLDRKFLTWRWYNDKDVKELFIHLLLTANFEDSDYENITIKRGQLKTKICDLVYQLKQSDSQIRNNLMKLKNTGEIAIKTTNKFSLVTIVNYDIYQTKNNENSKQNDKQNSKQSDTHSDKQTTNKQQTNNKQPIYNVLEEGKEVKKGKESKEGVSDRNFPTWIDDNLKSVFEEYLTIRKKLKVPNTDRVIKRLCDKLELYSGKNKLYANDIILNAINSSWKDFYALKDSNGNQIIPEIVIEKTAEEIAEANKKSEQSKKHIAEMMQELKDKYKDHNAPQETITDKTAINNFAENFGRV